jgi:putative GTP pyrophosphokinase
MAARRAAATQSERIGRRAAGLGVSSLTGPGMMTQDPEVLRAFLAAYEAYVHTVLQPIQADLRDRFAPWLRPEYWEKYKRTDRIPIPSPVRTTLSRIKRPEQVVDKIFRKPKEFPAGLAPDSFRVMRDALGVRILVYCLSHLPLIDRELRGCADWEVSTSPTPAAYMSQAEARVLGLDHMRAVEKESGYTSLHYTLRLRDHLPVAADESPWFEVQVRTLAQDLWSTMEHHLGYKPGTRTNLAAKRQFKVLSKMISAIDEHFNLLYDELNRFQEEVDYRDSDMLTAESIPSVLAEVGISCAQRDINNIIKFLYSRGVEKVRDVRALATAARLDIIRNTYLSETGRAPVNLEMIATLAALKGADEKAIRPIIKAQIAYRGAWENIRQEFAQDQDPE